MFHYTLRIVALGVLSLLVGSILGATLGSAAGCARVKPHQRELLTHPAMQAPVWSEQSKADEHVFEVRESSKGATGNVGGGCGCN